LIDWLVFSANFSIFQLYRGVSKENWQKDKQRSTKHYTEKQNNEQQGVNSGVQEGLAVPAPHLTPVVLLLSDTNIIW
jgi:hypothetical protein